MADHRQSGLTAAEGRRFAFTLAAGFGVLAALSYVRGRHSVALAFAGVAVVAIIAGAVAPQRLSGPRRAWMALGDVIGAVMRPVVLGVIYGIVLTPAGLIRRRLFRSPLARSRDASTYWIAVSSVADADARRGMEHMF